MQWWHLFVGGTRCQGRLQFCPPRDKPAFSPKWHVLAGLPLRKPAAHRLCSQHMLSVQSANGHSQSQIQYHAFTICLPTGQPFLSASPPPPRRRTGSDSCVTLQNLPWSPRWPVHEQVARLFNFLQLQAAKVSVVDTAAVAAAAAGGAANAGAGAAPLGGSMSPGAAGVMGQAGVGGLPPGFY